MNNKGYITAVALVSVGVLSFLALLYFFSRSQLAQNLFPTLARSQAGSTLGVFAQNNTRTGNLSQSMRTTPSVSRTPTPTVTRVPTIAPTATAPTSLVTQTNVTPRPTIRVTIAPVATSSVKSIPASGTTTGLIAAAPFLLAVGVGLRRRSR